MHDKRTKQKKAKRKVTSRYHCERGALRSSNSATAEGGGGAESGNLNRNVGDCHGHILRSGNDRKSAAYTCQGTQNSSFTFYFLVFCLFIAGCAIGPPKGVLRTTRYNAAKWQNMKLRAGYEVRRLTACQKI